MTKSCSDRLHVLTAQIILKARKNYLYEQYVSAGHDSKKILADVAAAVGWCACIELSE